MRGVGDFIVLRVGQPFVADKRGPNHRLRQLGEARSRGSNGAEDFDLQGFGQALTVGRKLRKGETDFQALAGLHDGKISDFSRPLQAGGMGVPRTPQANNHPAADATANAFSARFAMLGG